MEVEEELLKYIQNSKDIIVDVIQTMFFIIFSYYSNYRISNKDIKINKRILFKYIIILLTTISYIVIKSRVDHFIAVVSLISMIAIGFSIENIGKSIITTIISLGTNYILSYVSLIIGFIFCWIFKINNDYINVAIILIIHIIILLGIFKLKKFKYGLSFLQSSRKNNYIDILILNISVIVVFSIILIPVQNIAIVKNISIALILFSIIMFITIQKSLQLYYKQKMLIKELEETKEEVCKKTKEIEELEAENIKISKKNHTLSHKQKSLEYKIEQMLSNTEISKEEVAEVQERLKSIQKEFYNENATTELDKTEIPEIDDMLKYMQSECIKNKIDFELQIKGNIHHMTNNLITKEDLETLLADHIKNAIIAINHTDNVNRSILVRLGKIDETYSMYIYDTGVEFEKETLENLGKKPSTTHSDEGGTGMGFMNTFDTLRKCKASLIIEEYNKPSRDNYTKAMIVKFDEKKEFKINSYRESIMNKS